MTSRKFSRRWYENSTWPKIEHVIVVRCDYVGGGPTRAMPTLKYFGEI